MCHACCRAIICLPSFISHRPSICYLYTVLIVHTLHPYSHYCFLCMGISDSDAVLMNAEKKRQKSLQCNSKISTWDGCVWQLRSSSAELRLLSPTADTAPIRALKRLVLIFELQWSDFCLFFSAFINTALESEIPMHKKTIV